MANVANTFLCNLQLLVTASVNMMCLKTFFLLAEIERIQKGETKKEPEKETYLDLFATKNLKLKERVLIPTKQYPRVSVSLLFYSFRAWPLPVVSMGLGYPCRFDQSTE